MLRGPAGQEWPFPPVSRPALASSPRLTELWADAGLAGAAERWSLSFHREPSLWGLVTGRSSRPHSPTRCPSAAAVLPCSSASWVSPAVPTPRSPPSPPPGGCWSEWGPYSAGPASPWSPPQASPTCCRCSALRSRSTRCSSCPEATSGSQTPAGASWRCCSLSDTGAPAAASPLLPALPLWLPALSPCPLQLHLRAHPAGPAPGGPQHPHALHHRCQRGLPGGDPRAGEGCGLCLPPCSRPR